MTPPMYILFKFETNRYRILIRKESMDRGTHYYVPYITLEDTDLSYNDVAALVNNLNRSH